MLSVSDLHVIAVISNPVRYKSRIRLFKEFQERMIKNNIDLWVCETTFGEREPEAIDKSNPRHIHFRSDHEIWLKEAMINRVVERLPHDWKYMVWVDADIEFYNKDWAMETIQALQHYQVVQPFSHAIDLGPKGEVIQNHTGFMWCHDQGHKLDILKSAKYGTPPFFHPGFACAWRRDAWDTVGGLIEFAICGAGDHHMACALLGEVGQSMAGNLHENYYKMAYEWQRKAEGLKRNIGYVPGTILHHFHGKKADRGYQTRWGILQENNYDPLIDITKDTHGLPKLTGNKIKLRDDMRKYFRSRSEDSLET